MKNPNKFDTKQAAKFLGREPKTLENWRSEGKGPAYAKERATPESKGGRVTYYLEDLIAFQKATTTYYPPSYTRNEERSESESPRL